MIRYFDQLNAKDMTAENAASLIATLHEMDKGTIAQVNTLLLGENNWPKSFTSLWQRLTWLRVGQSLNVGSTTLSNLDSRFLPFEGRKATTGTLELNIFHAGKERTQRGLVANLSDIIVHLNYIIRDA
ncbi:hypothetical protein GPY51_19945 [Photorhabdus laumondii subsp. laumondii]|uniref:Uncharacterized protein n=2 Tax=Photorhabdus TaxID=29487 RepID=A0ABX0B8V3_9GAMM|nr:hypothetical protein A4R40_02560 [Photorhabdus laumondii subsp. laumondii]MCC8374486.1 hypothetical protein [Photorhabdus bodei]MCC8385762.1 hypothetical protein [Photorhabdus laumondii]MCT8353048.1 hypothetical protein [Photorhabdus kayaii]RAW67025.1 hypothetical protein CKY15_19755 [Photorhabdus sp. S7-51]RAW68287.1 hypothetical protein CKY14_19770 [Photorhabdus sp. S14-60]RAW73478.1 hypothetical protein CKY06_19995 [Photorhabdus sp. S15-56]RAW80624.1 hypothetical protein CKY09_20935 [P